MSRTLFWYIFKELLRIFLLASGAIAGIMSFGGLLRPFTEHGLDAAQVSRMLSYLMPAMSTYSLPIAALFATTMVYGRLAADNEITACRAAGISHGALAAPAALLGLGVAVLSLAFLCFIVPAALLKVEQVIYSNVAAAIVHDITRSHQITFKNGDRPVTVFAQDAQIIPRGDSGADQAVSLIGPTVVTFRTPEKSDRDLRVPKDFMMARRADIYLRQSPSTGRIALTIDLDGGSAFPREFGQGMQAAVGNVPIGPFMLASPIRYRPKFMDIRQLKATLRDPSQSPGYQDLLRTMAGAEQRTHFIREIVQQLNTTGAWTFVSGGNDVGGNDSSTADTRVICTIQRGTPPAVSQQDTDLLLSGPADAMDVRFSERQPGATVFTARANTARLSFGLPDDDQEIRVTADFQNVELRSAGGTSARTSYRRGFVVSLPPPYRYTGSLDPQQLLASPYLSAAQKYTLRLSGLQLGSMILGELHSRASFSVSCFILVLVGCALGMMFKSGNFLSAFAVSVIPALLCVTLIVAGQHKVEYVPDNLSLYAGAQTGLMIIWSGNAVVAVIATILLTRLQRQ